MKIGDENIERVVYESTLNLLIRYGIKGWNMDDLARECGMSKRTLYKIIGNKEDLLYKCYEDNFNKKLGGVKKFIEQDEDYYTLLDGLSTQIVNGVNEVILVTSENIRTEYPRISQMIDDRLTGHHKVLVAFFEKGIQLGLLRDNADATIIKDMLYALMNFNVIKYRDVSEFRTTTKRQLDFFFSSIRK
jgi:AcrR family transcriptional regulator